MKQLLTGCCLLLFANNLLPAQPATEKITISGTVVSAKYGEPVPGAAVYVAAQKKGVSTNGNGEFILALEPGTKKNIILQVTAVGYNAHTYQTAYKSQAGLVIKITEVPVGIGPPLITVSYNPDIHDPVEVRAVRAGSRSPFTKTYLTKAAFQKDNLGQDIPFLLNQTPSVVVNSDAGNGIGYTGIRIRGTDATRINMTINGIPYNDAESQGLFLVNLPDFASSVTSLQIQRGVGSSTNGAGAFGATLSFSTTENNKQPYAELNNSFGSFNSRKHTVKAGTGLLKGGFMVDARLSSIHSDGFIDRAHTDLNSYFISATWQQKETSIRFNLISGQEKTYQAWYGILEGNLQNNRRYNSAGTEKPGSPYDNETDNYKQTHYQLLFNHRLNTHYTFNITSFLTKGNGYYEQYKAQQKFSNFGLPNPVINGAPVTKTDLVRRLWLDNDFYGQNFSLHYNKENTTLIYGGSWNRYAGDHFGRIAWAQAGVDKDYEWYRYPALKTDANSFVKWQQQLSKKFDLYADLQYRHVNYRIDGFRNNPGVAVNQQYNFINPKAGISLISEKLRWSLSYALANKEPNRDDFEAGSSQLPKHETLHNVELNVNRNFGMGNTFNITGYYMGYRNQLILTGRINDVGAYTRQNIPNSYRVGIELQGSRYFGKKLSLSGSLAFSRNKIKSFAEFIDDYDNGGQKQITHRDKDIAFSPAVVGNATISINPVKNLQLRLMEKYVSRQYLDNTEDMNRVLRPYFVQDVVADYVLPLKGIKECRLLLQVNNVFNRKYEPNGYTFSYVTSGATAIENYYFPMAGINVMAGLHIKL
jgi:iron complex outermembrane recepter protein